MRLRGKQRKVPEGSGYLAVQLPSGAEDHGEASSASSTTSTASSSAAPTVVEISHVCATCRRLKISCEGEFPCQRCFRLSLPCRPQLPRAKKGPKRRMTPEEEEREERDRKRLSEAAKALPMVDLCLQRNNPRGHAQLYLEAFHRFHEEGRICRDKTISVLRYWQRLSQMAGSDVTLGMASVMGRALGIGSVDVEDADSLSWEDGNDGAREQRRTAAERETKAVSAALRASSSFRLEDEGVDSAVYMYVVDRHFGAATNEACASTFRAASELVTDVIRGRTAPSLLFAAMVEKDDRPTLFRCVVEGMFCHAGRGSTQIIKAPRDSIPMLCIQCFTRSGDITLYLLQSKWVQLDMATAAGGDNDIATIATAPTIGAAHVLKFTPIRKSRYVSDRPYHQQATKLFRDQQHAASGESGELAHGGADDRRHQPAPAEAAPGLLPTAASPHASAWHAGQSEGGIAPPPAAAAAAGLGSEPAPAAAPCFHFPSLAAMPVRALSDAQASSLLQDAPRLAPRILKTPEALPWSARGTPSLAGPVEAGGLDVGAGRQPLWPPAASFQGDALPPLVTGGGQEQEEQEEQEDRRDAWSQYMEHLQQQQQQQQQQQPDALYVPFLDEEVLLDVFASSSQDVVG